jgi:hypothetical protein
MLWHRGSKRDNGPDTVLSASEPRNRAEPPGRDGTKEGLPMSIPDALDKDNQPDHPTPLPPCCPLCRRPWAPFSPDRSGLLDWIHVLQAALMHLKCSAEQEVLP